MFISFHVSNAKNALQLTLVMVVAIANRMVGLGYESISGSGSSRV